MRGLLLGHDAAVAAWAFDTFNFKPMPVEGTIGIISEKQELIGAALFQHHNGNDIELSYYGRNTLTPGIVRAIARAALGYGIQRLTVTTAKSNRRFVKAILRLGFIHESAMKQFYGKRDDLAEHTGMRMVCFKKRLEQLAGITPGPALMPIGKDPLFMKKHQRRRK